IVVAHITGSSAYFRGRARSDESNFIFALLQDVGVQGIAATGAEQGLLTDLNGIAAAMNAVMNMQPTFSARAQFAYQDVFHNGNNPDLYLHPLVQGYYLRFLHRAADAAGLDSWTTA